MQASDEVAQQIMVLRRALGVTQERLASLIGVTFSTVSRWENGHVRPSKLAWRAMAQLAADRNCPLDASDDRGVAATGTTSGRGRQR